MHILTTTSATLDDLVEPVDLGQTPGEMVVASFTDSDLGALARAWRAERDTLPSLRLASLRDLRHPMSVDLWVDKVASKAKFVVVRLLGGLDWWRYGVERLSVVAREKGIALAVLPGEDRDDPRLSEASTVPAAELEALLGYFRAGGPANMRALLRRLAGLEAPVPQEVPLAGFYAWSPSPQPSPRRGEGAEGASIAKALSPWGRGLGEGEARAKAGSAIPIIFYRSMWLADDTAPVDALCAALEARGLTPKPIFVASLKDPASAAFLTEALAKLNPTAIVTLTAFAAGDPGEATVLDAPGVPVLQAVVATTKREAWASGARGLASADLAMHVVLPELDGRILAGALSFKAPAAADDDLGFTGLVNRPEPDRIAQVAKRVAALARLQATPRAERRVAVLMPDYAGAPGRTGWAVGLDVPASILSLLGDLRAAGYAVEGVPADERALLGALSIQEPRHPEVPGVSRASKDARPGGRGEHPSRLAALAPQDDVVLSIEDYHGLLAELPSAARESLHAAWGDPATDPDVHDGAFHFRAAWCGNILVGIAPDRGRHEHRRADYHDPALPPRHALVAFGLWLRHVAKVDALVHMGAHGTLEWLPGKHVALTSACFPELVLGALPIIYPFIVSNPGEAAQAKRRIAAVTLGHLPPPLIEGGLSGDARELERLLDEYAQADGLDRRRRERLAMLIVEEAERTGLAREAGVGGNADEALKRIDAWLCDVKELRLKDGFHIYGRGVCGDAERDALLAALDGHRVAAGPAGAPGRGRTDVLPTGRNLFTSDPRTLPTPTAFDLGRLAAEEVVRAYAQAHGDWPRSLVLDLWGSASLRTGGEEIAQGLALMGCRPMWDNATGRITGIEVLPTAAMGRPRVDVTFRISGLFRDLFPAQIALIDAAVRAVAARDEPAEDNPLAATPNAPRIFGTAPGAYGAGVEQMLGTATREEMGDAYLGAASHAYGGVEGEGQASDVFTERVATADLLVHAGDDPGRDLLEGDADLAFIGGFAAAAERLGRMPDLVVLDTADPLRPRARPLSEALARIVRGRADPRYLAGLMRHGPRGAAEMAETVDRLVGFAETTRAVPSHLIELLHDAFLGDAAVRDFLMTASPDAARVVAARFGEARAKGLWHPRRNDVDAGLAVVSGEAAE
ncbi:cobaltochelatase subunit CobN [Starkeya sp. ORNL1]|uniref:cobaltochelatase subunit CobN n=1 Tax=Starkeya sp. ORNL1 TaxID=2709380 RepID=UPI0014632EEF|nr:cobaltochelatase subunit CobN [Starkeya sp. ORNL1]QJP17059.1 cobaltochelatase subunit CobN [Starkeya sp. ORNL1]